MFNGEQLLRSLPSRLRGRQLPHRVAGADGLEILDRIGGRDSFASAFVHGLLDGFDVDTALAYGAAHGALAMTCPDDTPMATLAEVERLVAGPLAGSIANSRHVWTYDVCVAELFRSSGVQPHAVRERGGSWRPARFAAVVVEELARQIISGAFAVDDVLPTEPALCEQFGFSRTVIREALKMLEERGLVRIEQGRGTTVQPRDAWNLLDPVVLRIALEYDTDLSLLDDLIVVRRELEREMARAAAKRLSDEDLAALVENLEQMEGAFDDYERFRAYDQGFHAIVMKASGNEVGLTIVRVIHRHGGVMPPLASATSRTALKETARDHRGILEALVARDGELAGARIASHIDSAWAERRDRAGRT